MAKLHVEAQRSIAAPPATVYALVSDYQRGRPRFLPANYQDWRVEEGGLGAGTTVSYRLRAARRERSYRVRVEEPTAGSVLVERDTGSSLVTTWSLEPAAEGTRTTVRLSSEWEGAGGVGGFFERLFAPAGLRRIHDDTLAGLARVAEGGDAPAGA